MFSGSQCDLMMLPGGHLQQCKLAQIIIPKIAKVGSKFCQVPYAAELARHIFQKAKSTFIFAIES